MSLYPVKKANMNTSQPTSVTVQKGDDVSAISHDVVVGDVGSEVEKVEKKSYDSDTSKSEGNDTHKSTSNRSPSTMTAAQMEAGERNFRKSGVKGESEIEELAKRVEERNASRVPITLAVRKRFLNDCVNIALARGYEKSVISSADLKIYQKRVQKELDNRHNDFKIKFLSAIGFKHDAERLVEMTNRAVEVLEGYKMTGDDFFYYQDFNYYYTVTESRVPWLRSEYRKACLVVFLYYFFTPILFCHITGQESICVGGPGSYEGWMSSLYFASTTLSTVGYGDLTVSQDPKWRSFMGILYMIISMWVAIVAFTAAASHATSSFSPIEDTSRAVANYLIGKGAEDDFLYQKVRRMKFVKYFEVALQFTILNMIGVFASRFFMNASDEVDWSWMTSFYWSVQTTTTIGYGDLDQPFEFRWFKIFYLTLATYAVGNCLGKLGALKEDLQNLRREHAWRSRKVTKRFIREMQADETDDKVDQYEFLVASLLNLGKLNSDDVEPIMEKFRELSNGKSYISIERDAEDDYNVRANLAFEEEVAQDEIGDGMGF